MEYKELAEFIVKNVGGKDNINSLIFCTTRLRFTLINESLADKENLEQNEGILQVIKSGGQYQVVVGTHVEKVCNSIYEIIGYEVKKTDNKQKQRKIDAVFEMFAAIFMPFVSALAGAGIIRGLLALFVSIGWMTYESGAGIILFSAADSVIYFLPLFLAITTARYFKVDEFIALALGAAMIYPDILNAVTSGTQLQFMGIDLVLMNYTSSVVPIIFIVFILSKFDKFLARIIPDVLKSFAIALIELIVLLPLSLMIIGPVLSIATDCFTDAFMAIYHFNPIIFGFIFGISWAPLAVFGLHSGFMPINMNNFATMGKDYLLPITMPSNFAQTGAALGVAIRSKDQKIKSIASSNILTGLLGITEPIMYGVTLPLKRPFYFSCLMAGVCGAIVASAGVYCVGLPAGGVLATPVFAEHALIWYIAGCLIAFIGSFLLTITFGFFGKVETKQKDIELYQDKKEDNEKEALVTPVRGKTIDLTQIHDNAFKSLSLGKGIAVLPEEGSIYAPCNGIITALFPTNHAIGILSEGGAEVLIHVGIDSVKLNGEGFHIYVQKNQKVKKGDLILMVDLNILKQHKIEDTVIMVITNTSQYLDIIPVCNSIVNHNDEILYLIQ